MRAVDRSEFLRLGVAGALATAAGATLAPSARAGGPPPAPQGDDLGFLQWAATAELVSVAYWDRALHADLDDPTRHRLRAMRSADADHLGKLSAVLGDEAPTTEDFEILLPDRAFASAAGAVALGREIENHVVRVYLGAVSNALDPGTRLLLAQLLVNDTQHLDALRALDGASSAFASLRGPLELEPAGRWLDRFLRVRSS